MSRISRLLLLCAMTVFMVSPTTSLWAQDTADTPAATASAGEDAYTGDADLAATAAAKDEDGNPKVCLLYTSPSPRDQRGSRMPSSA